MENHGELGLSMITDDLSVSFMKKGSALIVGPKDEKDAISLYESLGKRDRKTEFVVLRSTFFHMDSFFTHNGVVYSACCKWRYLKKFAKLEKR